MVKTRKKKMQKYRGYACQKPSAKYEPFEYELPQELNTDEVELKVTHNGLCHTDFHMRNNDWNMSQYPLISGHEIVGTVIRLGSNVNNLFVGDRVGVSILGDSCRKCRYCLIGKENCCQDASFISLSSFGGFQEKFRVKADFAFVIPKNLDSVHVAPLLCAGITVYNPIRSFISSYEFKPANIGIIGIGGLGHLAIQFAKAFGAIVTVFSTSKDKEEECRKFGATHFIDTSNPENFKKCSKLDMILDTLAFDHDREKYIKLLVQSGSYCVVGLPKDSKFEIHGNSLVMGQIKIEGSLVGGRALVKEMLELASQNNIVAKTELMPLSKINEAMDRIEKSAPRYRIVLISDFE